MSTVLLLVNLNTHLPEQLRVAQLLQKTAHYDPIIYFTRHYPGLAQDIDFCQQSGISIAGVKASSPSARQQVAQQAVRDNKNLLQKLYSFIMAGRNKSRFPLKEALRNFLDQNLPFLLIPFYYLRYRASLKAVLQVLRRHKVALLILPIAGVSYDAHIWIKAARQVRCPQLIIPFNYGQNFAAYAQQSRLSLQKLHNRITAHFYPQWVIKHEGKKALRLSGAEILVIEWLKMAPPNPLLLYSSHADAMTLGSQAMWDYYADMGMDTAQFVLTGDLFNDVLAEILQEAQPRREALYAALGLPPGKPMLLCSLPPNQLHTLDVQSDFPTYEALVTFWVRTLQQFDNFNLVLNLHPRITAAERTFIERLGAAIAPHETTQMIPLCDLHVASVSSVIRLAVACGKPVVNYDVYRYRYAIYSGIPGVIEVSEAAEFEETTRRLTQDSAYYAEIKAGQAAVMEYWGKLDGKAGERLLALFDQLTAGRDAAAG